MSQLHNLCMDIVFLEHIIKFFNVVYGCYCDFYFGITFSLFLNTVYKRVHA